MFRLVPVSRRGVPVSRADPFSAINLVVSYGVACVIASFGSHDYDAVIYI